MSNDNKDRNASPSAYGWTFQVGAGITLMLENIKDFTHLKMEGKDDDIELSFDNGKLFAQAKSVTQIGDQRSASTDLTGALSVFKDDYKKSLDSHCNALGFVYVSNIINPLSSKIGSAFKYGHTYDFSSLSTDDQQKIIEKIGDDFPVEKIKIKIIHFFGEGENKWDDIKEKIAEFLRSSIDDPSYNKKLMDNWIADFITNCADKPKENKELNLSKKEIILPIIILVIENIVSESNFSKVSDYDNFDELKKKYRKVLYTKECDYQFVSSIIADFMCEKKSHSKLNSFEYVNNFWSKYEKNFVMINVDEEKEALTKLSVLSVLLQRSKIDGIRKEANLL